MPECHARDRAAEWREFALQPIVQRPGFGRGHLVLNGDVRTPALFVLRREVFVPEGGKLGAETGGFWRVQRVGNAAAEKAEAGDAEGGWGLLGAKDVQIGTDIGQFVARQMVEQGDVGGDLVQRRGEPAAALFLEKRLRSRVKRQGEDKRWASFK